MDDKTVDSHASRYDSEPSMDTEHEKSHTPTRPRVEVDNKASDTTIPPTDMDLEKGSAVVTPSPPSSPTNPNAGPPPNAFDPRQNPDGGLEAWIVVLGAACCLFCSFGWINCIGVFQDYYQLNQLSNYSPSTIAWIPSCETFFMFFLGPFIGAWYDNRGPREILLLGTFLHVFGLMMTSLSSKYYQILLAQGICSAAGASMCFYPAMSVLPTWFFHKRAAAFGIMAAGSSTGGVIFPIMVSHLIPRVGFGWTMRICAFLILFLMIIANLTVRARIPPHPKPFHVMQFVNPLRELPFALVVCGSFLFFFAMFLPINYLIVFSTSIHMSTHLSSYLIPILNAASFFGRVLPGIIADKAGRFNTMIVMCAFTGIIVLALWLPAASNAPTLVFAALYGFGSGAFVSLAPSLVAQISDVKEIGVRNGAVFAIISIAALCSNPVGGALIQAHNGGYQGLQVFAGVMAIAGAVGIAGARFVLAGADWRAKV